MAFDPKQHFIRLQNKDYLPVAARIAWLRDLHPNWSIITEAIQLDFQGGLAIFKATISDENGTLIATGHKTETRKGFADFVEKAEAGAIGRAIAYVGLGTLNAQELEEGERIADSPQEPKQRQSSRPPRTPAEEAAVTFFKAATKAGLIPQGVKGDEALAATRELAQRVWERFPLNDKFHGDDVKYWEHVLFHIERSHYLFRTGER